MSRYGTIPVPDEAPNWASVIVSGLIDWVLNLRAGPQPLSAYPATARPSATSFRRSLIYDSTANAPAYSDASGAWNGLASTTAATFTSLAITQGAIISGTYSPTATSVANLDAFSASSAIYMRVGAVVTVSGYVTADPTAPASSTQGGLSLPIASNIGANEDVAGSAFASGIAGQGAAILGDVTNDRAQIQWVSGDVTSQRMYYTYQYRII